MGMEKLKSSQSSVKQAAEFISLGKIVALPTETVYGLAGRADREETVDKLYSLKKRPREKSFSIALADAGKAASSYFRTLSPFGFRLIENFWPGPLTLVYYRKTKGKVGIRVPSASVASRILRRLDFPVFLPSANLNGEKDAYSPAEVEKVFAGSLDLLIDAGTTQYQQSSTVLDLTYKPFKILRQGVITEAQIASVFVKRRVLFVCTGNSCRSPLAEYILRKRLKQQRFGRNQRYEVISAGVSASALGRAAGNTQEIIRRREGMDMSGFKPSQLTKEMVLSSDYIFTMEDSQAKYILEQVSSAEARVFNLKKFLPAANALDIPDPIGKSFTFYEKVYNIIKGAVLELADWL